MTKFDSTFYQARADEAAEDAVHATLAGAKRRHERSRVAWQGLADDARVREADKSATDQLKQSRKLTGS